MKSRVRLTTEEALFIKCLYDEYYSLMFSVTKRFGLQKADREDIVSTAMISLMNNTVTLQKLQPEERKYYITKAVISTSINHMKRQDALQKAVSKNAAAGYDLKSEIIIEDQVILKIELMDIIKSIMALPEKESQCIRMKYLLGYNNSEIAGMTELSENSVNQYIMRARKQIRTMLYNK